MFYGFELTLNIPLIINNAVPRDSNMDDDIEGNEVEGSPETNPSATISSTFSTDSNEATVLNSDSEKSPDRHFNATFEDSEVEVPRTAKRMMGKRKRSKGALQRSDSTSEDKQHPAPLKTRSRAMHNQPRPSRTEAAPAKGRSSRKVERQQGKKRKQVGFQDKNLVDSESSDETFRTGGPRKRQRKEKKNVRKHKNAVEKVSKHHSLTGRKRKRHKDPTENEDSPSKQDETLNPGPLRQTTNHEDPAEQRSEDDCSSKGLQKRKGKNVHPQVSEESESSTNKPVTRGEAKRRRRENENNPADPAGAEATPPRKRKRKK